MNLSGADMQKPEINAVYKIFSDEPIRLGNLMRITSINEQEGTASYYVLTCKETIFLWSYVRYPEHLFYKLTTLEEALL